jgi:serine/threonine protein kinase
MYSVPVIPGFELLCCLGGGPMTVVYSARCHQDDSACAVKLIRPEWEDGPTAAKLLQREARAGLAVQHPHLVRLRYAHVTRDPYFLVMDLLPGECLRERLQRDYWLDPLLAISVARQAAEALAALHSAGFLHGDVKPENIRLLGDGTVQLLDLGFAHRPGENATFLRAGYVLGTADYLAPELCGPEPSDGFAADIFGLGVVLYESLTGRLPYPPGTLAQTFRRHQCDPPADIRKHRPDLPANLAALVHRLLALRPEDRPRAAALVQQLIRLEITTLARRRSA